MIDGQSTQQYIPDPRRWRILTVLAVTLFMSLIDVSIVTVALPSIQTGLEASTSELQWVLSGYALTFGIGLVSAGRAGDLFGRGPLFIIGVALFTITSAAAGFAPDALWLNISRALQGIAAGLFNPQMIGMIQQYFRGAERGRAFGVFGGVVGVSVAAGPLLGGLLIHAAGVQEGWRWVFFVNLPVGILAIVLAFLWLPKPLLNSRQGQGLAVPGVPKQSRDLDMVGAVLLGLAVVAVLFPFLESRESALVWAVLPFGGVLLAVWLWWERRYKRLGKSPMVDLGIFQVKSFANGTLLVGLYFLGMTSIWVLIALYFQDGLGHSALATGMVGLPSAIASGIAALWGGRKVAEYGRKVVVGGLYFGLFGLATSILVVWLQAIGAASEWWLLLSLTFVGVSQGAVISPNQTLTLAEVPLEYAGSSGGIMQTGQRIGTSVGIALITAVAFTVLGFSNWSMAFIAGLTTIFILVVLTLVVGYADLRSRRAGE
ncbi:MFS transporter [Arthrobacter sp. H35-D1]|uniref:MFS transporter n=1 Tax=Arthrobacter sp. H35-D1 TaxID=3046202 RepID=UPI0024BA9F8C|nr:MFS transporter [Arthrobacter sp. H35-D1]MDJ0314668.1 MFS transporter [Arthrobacter sp. H35-D1]